MLDEHTHKVWGLVLVLKLVHAVYGTTVATLYAETRSFFSVTPQTNSIQKDYIHSILLA